MIQNFNIVFQQTISHQALLQNTKNDKSMRHRYTNNMEKRWRSHKKGQALQEYLLLRVEVFSPWDHQNLFSQIWVDFRRESGEESGR